MKRPKPESKNAGKPLPNGPFPAFPFTSTWRKIALHHALSGKSLYIMPLAKIHGRLYNAEKNKKIKENTVAPPKF